MYVVTIYAALYWASCCLGHLANTPSAWQAVKDGPAASWDLLFLIMLMAQLVLPLVQHVYGPALIPLVANIVLVGTMLLTTLVMRFIAWKKWARILAVLGALALGLLVVLTLSDTYDLLPSFVVLSDAWVLTDLAISFTWIAVAMKWAHPSDRIRRRSDLSNWWFGILTSWAASATIQLVVWHRIQDSPNSHMSDQESAILTITIVQFGIGLVNLLILLVLPSVCQRCCHHGIDCCLCCPCCSRCRIHKYHEVATTALANMHDPNPFDDGLFVLDDVAATTVADGAKPAPVVLAAPTPRSTA